MKKFALWMCCALLVFGVSQTAAAETLKIGTLSPLTGPYAQDGTDIKQGVMTAVDVFGSPPADNTPGPTKSSAVSSRENSPNCGGGPGSFNRSSGCP